MEMAAEFTSQTATPFYGWFGGLLVVFLDHPDDVNAVLKACIEKPYVVTFMGFETSLLSAPGIYSFNDPTDIEYVFFQEVLKIHQFFAFTSLGCIWSPQRKVLNKAFNLKILESFIPIFNEKVKYLIRNLGKQVQRDDFEITPLIYHCTLDMVCGKCFKYLHIMQ